VVAATSAERVVDAFVRVCGHDPAGVWMAPGRVNLIGEHTDYNDGFVLPMAVGLATFVAVAPATTGRTTVRSLQQPGDEVRFRAAGIEPGDVRGWAAYVAGVFWAFREAGVPAGELDVVIDGQVPRGAGLSSSAALECALAVALSDLGGHRLGRVELAGLAHAAENRYVAAPTGVMDQLASMLGHEGELTLIDTRTLAVRYLPLDLGAAGLALVVIDTRTPHTLVDGQYAARRRSCEAAAAALGVAALRDIELRDLDDALTRLVDPVQRRRLRHVVSENARVLDVARLLDGGADPRDIGPALTASHISLRDDFEVSVARLDLAVASALAAGAHGARMTGAGFGGCAIALTDANREDEVARAVGLAYQRAGFAPPATFAVVPSRGAGRVR
jgi:galactokinase